MATATLTLINSLTITACDSTTADGSWSNISPSLGTTDPPQIEGTGRLEAIVKQADDTNESAFAKTGGANLSGKTLRWPLFTILKPNLKTKALGGIQLAIDDGTNKGYFNCSGGDSYTGGWELISIDCGATPDEGTDPTEASTTTIAINFKLAAAAKNIATVFYDYIYCADGIKVNGGTTSDKVDMAAIDTADVYYLQCESIKGVYRLRGELQFGDDTGTSDCYFASPGDVVFFDDLPVSDTLYELTALGNATGTTAPDLSNMFFTSENAKAWKVNFATTTNVTSITLDSTTFQNASNGVSLSSICSGDGTVIDTCGQVTPSTATLDNFTIKNSSATAALSLPATHNIGAGTFISAGTGHAITGYAAAGDYTLTDWTFSGYAATDGSTGNEAVYVTATTGTVNLTVSGGSTPSIRTAGATVNVIVGAVTVQAKATLKAGTPVESARVFLKASDGTGPFPFEETVTSITRSTTTATVGHTAHGMATNDKIYLQGITDKTEDNWTVLQITVTDANTYTYTTTDSGSTSYTGTIKCTFVALNGVTNASGILSTSRVYSANQPVTGWTRKASASPLLQEGVLVGEIDSSLGFSGTAVMLADE